MATSTISGIGGTLLTNLGAVADITSWSLTRNVKLGEIVSSSTGGRVARVPGALDWTALPEAHRNHPTTEHLFPLYVALGAGGAGARGRLLHRDVEMGGLALDAFAFDTA